MVLHELADRPEAIVATKFGNRFDPVTKKASVVFSCFNQDQDIDCVDFEFLNSRLRQASMYEKLTNLWLNRLLTKENVIRI